MTEQKKGKLAAWAALPVLATALYLTRRGEIEPVLLFLRELLLLFGYVAAVGDIRTRLVPNRLVLAMVGVWAVVMTPQLLLRTEETVPLAVSGAIGALLAGVMFLTVYILSRHGLGGGDVKFMTAAGLYLGAQGVLPTMLVGSVLAAAAGIVLIAVKRIGRKDAIALIPFLYIGALMTMFFR